MAQVNAPWREEHAGTRIKRVAFLVQKLLAKNNVGKKQLFCFFLSLAHKPLMLAQICSRVSERTSQGLSNAFSQAS